MLGLNKDIDKKELKALEREALSSVKSTTKRVKSELKFSSSIMVQLNKEFKQFGEQNKLIHDQQKLMLDHIKSINHRLTFLEDYIENK